MLASVVTINIGTHAPSRRHLGHGDFCLTIGACQSPQGNEPMNTLTPAFLPVIWMCAYIDTRTRRIPNRITYPSLVVVAALRLFDTDATAYFLAGAAGFAILFIPALILGPEKAGVGDAKLVAVMGLLLGWPHLLLSLALTFLLAVVVTLPPLAARRLSLHSTIPLGPFLAAGYSLTILWPFLAALL